MSQEEERGIGLPAHPQDSPEAAEGAPQEEELTGIGGWLGLLAASLGLSLVVSVLQIVGLILICLKAPSLTVGDGLSLALLVLLDAGLSGALAVLFFRKRRAFLKLYTAGLALNLALAIPDMIHGALGMADWIGIAVAIAWIAYFRKSRRVANTFH